MPASSRRNSGVRRKNPADGPGRKHVSGQHTAAKISRAHLPGCPEHARCRHSRPEQRRSTWVRSSLWIWNRMCGRDGRRSRKNPHVAWLPQHPHHPARTPGQRPLHHSELPPNLQQNDHDEIPRPKHGWIPQSASPKPKRKSARQTPMPRQGPGRLAACCQQQGCWPDPPSAPSATALQPVR